MKKLDRFLVRHESKIMQALIIAIIIAFLLVLKVYLPDLTGAFKSMLPSTEKAELVVSEAEGWQNLDEDERVLKAISLGGNTAYLNKREIALYNEVVDFVNSVSGKSEFEIALAAHDYVCETTAYDETVDTENNSLSYGYDSASAYGSLVLHYTVCAGYARAYRLLLSACGMEAYYVVGDCPGGAHAWNIARIDGDYYHTDTTFDDYSQNYKFFLCPDGYMSASREWDAQDYPSCNSYDYSENKYKEVSSEAEAFEYACEQISEDGCVFLKCRFYVSDFRSVAEYFMTNIQIFTQVEGEYVYYSISLQP